MDTLVTSTKSTLKRVDEYRNHIIGGACIITAVVLLTLALHNCHFSQVSLNWIKDYSLRVFQPVNFGTTISFFAGSGALLGAGFFILKGEWDFSRKKKAPTREKRFLYSIMTIMAIFLGGAVAYYGLHSLVYLKPVCNLNLETMKPYQIGYVAKGVEAAFGTLFAGSALTTWALFNTIDKFKLRKET